MAVSASSASPFPPFADDSNSRPRYPPGWDIPCGSARSCSRCCRRPQSASRAMALLPPRSVCRRSRRSRQRWRRRGAGERGAIRDLPAFVGLSAAATDRSGFDHPTGLVDGSQQITRRDLFFVKCANRSFTRACYKELIELGGSNGFVRSYGAGPRQHRPTILLRAEKSLSRLVGSGAISGHERGTWLSQRRACSAALGRPLPAS